MPNDKEIFFIDFDIFKSEDFNNYSPIQLIDFQGDLRNFLIQKKIPFVDFNSGINEQGLILAGVSPKNKKRNKGQCLPIYREDGISERGK